MKKPVIAALCCLLALGTATAAFADEPAPTPAPELVELSPEDIAPQFYPDSISWQEDGGQLLVVKQYSVPYGTAVADLTESGMQWGGSDYTLWGVTQSVEGGVTEEKEVTQDFAGRQHLHGNSALRRDCHSHRGWNRALYAAVRAGFCTCGGCCCRKQNYPRPVDYGYCLCAAFYRGAADYHPSAAQRACPRS